MPDNSVKRFSLLWIWLGLVSILIIILVTVIPGMGQLDSGPRIGLVEITGPIYSSQKAVKDLSYFENRHDIAAIVVRLETPGGGVAASQEIFEKVKKLADSWDGPVLASMGGVAASGGYYIAIGADTIMANPGTATGSIGVIMGYPTITGLMEKLGLEYETVKSGELKDAGSTFRQATDTDLKYFQSLIDNLYEQFIMAISERRELDPDRVRELGTGQVYSGQQAVELGLIDLLGTQSDCIKLAAELAGYEEKPVVVRPPEKPKSWLRFLMGENAALMDGFLSFPVPEYRMTF